MSKNILCLKGISKAFGGVHALDNVDLCVKEGQIHCLMGENGSGKSTLIKVISGVYQPDSGEIMLNGNLYHKLNPAESVRQGVQIIYQDFSVFPNLTVAGNIIFGQTVAEKQKLTHNKKKRQNAAKIAQEIGLKADLSEIVENLSVAEKQMVAICRALLNDAKLLIFDEPTTALTQKEVKNLFALIHKMQKKGVSTLFVSHKLEEVFEIAEEFTILRNGKKVITTDAASITREKFIFYMTGRQLSEKQFVMNVCKTGDPLLEVRDLSMEGFYKNVNFSLYPGEILGIVGLLGSGRTELALSLFGVKPADNGKILKNGKVIQITSILEAMKNRIGYVPEDRLSEGLFLPQSINWNVGIANLKAYSGRFGKLEKKKMEQVSEEYVKQLDIATDNIDKASKFLSGGNQQKVVISRWLSCNPDIMIFNCPTVGVDIAAKYDIHDILRKLASKNMGIIIISDDIPEVYANCNRIFVMNKGQIIKELENVETSEEELYALMSSNS